MPALTVRLEPPRPLTKRTIIPLLPIPYIQPRWYSVSISHMRWIYEPQRYREVVQMGIYIVEAPSTVKIAVQKFRFLKGCNHIVLSRETGGCSAEYHEIPSNLQVIGTWQRHIYVNGSAFQLIKVLSYMGCLLRNTNTHQNWVLILDCFVRKTWRKEIP